MKLKLFLLGGIFALFGIFNFSNAETINYSCDEENTCEGSILYDKNLCIDGNYNANFSFSSLPTCNLDECWFSFEGLSLEFNNNGFIRASCDPEFEFPEGESYLNLQSIEPMDDVELPHSGTITITDINSGGGDGGDDNTGGGDDNVNVGGGVISDGFGSLTPVITGVKDVTFQLIPMVVYIGIGVLITVLGFFAIRWLVNWIVGKINSNFSSKRG